MIIKANTLNRMLEEVQEGLKDAYGEGQVSAAVKANTTSEKENQGWRRRREDCLPSKERRRAWKNSRKIQSQR